VYFTLAILISPLETVCHLLIVLGGQGTKAKCRDFLLSLLSQLVKADPACGRVVLLPALSREGAWSSPAIVFIVIVGELDEAVVGL
jgi:hypothetical protein